MLVCRHLVYYLVFLILPSLTAAFSASSSRRTAEAAVTFTAHQQSAKLSAVTVDRKGFLQSTGLSTMALVFAAAPAHADVTNKVASSAALRNVKLSQKRLIGLQDVVDGNEYTELKEALRAAPISDIRKNMSTLVKGGEDGPDAPVLQDKYKRFIASLEKMDGTASLALRGKRLSEGEFSLTYQATVEALNDFLQAAQTTAEIPVQFSE